MQNAGINWQTGEIVSQFDGTWPMLDEQLVVLYDQLVNGGIRRSIIPVRRNGEEGLPAGIAQRGSGRMGGRGLQHRL